MPAPVRELVVGQLLLAEVLEDAVVLARHTEAAPREMQTPAPTPLGNADDETSWWGKVLCPDLLRQHGRQVVLL